MESRIRARIADATHDIKYGRVAIGILIALVLTYSLHLWFYRKPYAQFRAERLGGTARAEHLSSCPHMKGWACGPLPPVSPDYTSPPGCYCLSGPVVGPTRLFLRQAFLVAPHTAKNLLHPLSDAKSGWPDRVGLFVVGLFWFMLLTVLPLALYVLFPNIVTWFPMFFNMMAYILYPIFDAMMHI